MVAGHSARYFALDFHVALLVAAFAAAFFLLLPPCALAQNVTQFQEEEIKDKEREVKKKQLEQERKAEEAKVLSQPMTEEELQNANLVEVQPLNVLPSDLTSSYRLLPYKYRRAKWGHMITLGASMYQPVNYQTYFESASAGSYSLYYPSPSVPLVELCYTYRYNWAFGGIGIDVAYSYFQAQANQATFGAGSLTIQPIRIGGKLILDTLFGEPYVAPFVYGGMYEAFYSESQGNVTAGGNTAPALYYGAGVLLQLNWLDESAAVESYNQSGIENSYFYIDVRQYQQSSSAADPNLSSNLVVGGGVAMEF